VSARMPLIEDLSRPPRWRCTADAQSSRYRKNYSSRHPHRSHTLQSAVRSSAGRSGNVAVYRSVNVVTICLYRFEVEATPAGESITHPKNYWAAHVVWCAISAGSAPLPFCPDRGAVDSTAEQFCCVVGNAGEDLLLVPAYLVSPGERSAGWSGVSLSPSVMAARRAAHASGDGQRVSPRPGHAGGQVERHCWIAVCAQCRLGFERGR